MLLGL